MLFSAILVFEIAYSYLIALGGKLVKSVVRAHRAPHRPSMTTQRLFEFDADLLEYRFVEEVGEKTLYRGVIARLFLGSSWALAWRKVVSLEDQTFSSWRSAHKLSHFTF